MIDHFWYDWQLAENRSEAETEDITVFWDPEYYSCYTIAAPNATETRGLSAIFYIHNFPPEAREFFKFYVELAMISGVRLIVHPHGTKAVLGRWNQHRTWHGDGDRGLTDKLCEVTRAVW